MLLVALPINSPVITYTSKIPNNHARGSGQFDISLLLPSINETAVSRSSFHTSPLPSPGMHAAYPILQIPRQDARMRTPPQRGGGVLPEPHTHAHARTRTSTRVPKSCGPPSKKTAAPRRPRGDPGLGEVPSCCQNRGGERKATRERGGAINI